MSSPSDPRDRTVRPAAPIARIAAVVLALSLPVSAFSGLATVEEDRAAGQAAPATAPAEPHGAGDEPKVLERGGRVGQPASRTGGAYQIRCWQYGKLVFEENDLAIDLGKSDYATKLRGTDRKGSALYVADTKNATCLIKSVSGERPWRR